MPLDMLLILQKDELWNPQRMWNTAAWDDHLMLRGEPVLEGTEEKVWKSICTFAGFKAYSDFMGASLFNPQARLRHVFAFFFRQSICCCREIYANDPVLIIASD